MSRYWEQELGTGIACYSDESGKIEMVGFRRNPAPKENRITQLLKLRRFIKANAKPGMTIKRSTYVLGWQIGHSSTHWTLWTIGIDQGDGFTFFRAIPDIHKGYDIDDEKLVVQTVHLFELKAYWDLEWKYYTTGD